MFAENSSTIESSSRDFRVRLENHDEHHMGASTVFIKLSRRIAHRSRFKTTNGRAFFTPDGDGLFIHDACLIVFADLRTEEFFNLEPPSGWYFTRVRIEEGALAYELYDPPSGERQLRGPIPLTDLRSRFEPGLGIVRRGRFPSAHP